ncbi:hypothetical protein MBLNU230_g1470t1 [Neophaeotheca triangularis]
MPRFGVLSSALLALSSTATGLVHRDHGHHALLDVEQPLIKLRPKHTSTRDLVNLDGLWKFNIVPESGNTTFDAESTQQTWTQPLSPYLECPVPASFNDIFLDQEIRNHVGWVLYQKNVRVPRGWSAGDRYLVRAESATHRGRIYINDRIVAEHQGGYLPFEADITDLVSAGQEFRMTIAVNNELNFETIPPGVVYRDEYTGDLRQDYFHDFYNYAGLARSVWMYSVPQEHIQDVTVTTDVEGETGIINYDVQVANGADGNGRVEVCVLDEEGNIVANGTGAQGSVNIESVNLWQPGAAYLYDFTVNIVADDGSVTDTYSVATGVRTVEIRGTQFLINGQPFYFTGFGKHEDAAIRGKGHDNPFMVHDFELLDWIGANSFRTSHYPYSEDIMDFADRRGIVVIDETAAVGQHFTLNSVAVEVPDVTFQDNGVNNVSRAHLANDIRELISRDKNHASVVMWSLVNEPASQESGARGYFEPLTELARSLDARPITYANVATANWTSDAIADLFDFTMLNRYFGWYETPGQLDTAELALREDLQGWIETYPRPVMMSEYGADTIAGLHSVRDDTLFAEEFQSLYFETYHRVFDEFEAFVGEHVWNFADFQTKLGVGRVDGNKKGVFTRERRPKSAVQLLRNRWTGRDSYGQPGE